MQFWLWRDMTILDKVLLPSFFMVGDMEKLYCGGRAKVNSGCGTRIRFGACQKVPCEGRALPPLHRI